MGASEKVSEEATGLPSGRSYHGVKPSIIGARQVATMRPAKCSTSHHGIRKKGVPRKQLAPPHHYTYPSSHLLGVQPVEQTVHFCLTSCTSLCAKEVILVFTVMRYCKDQMVLPNEPLGPLKLTKAIFIFNKYTSALLTSTLCARS